MPLVPRPTSLVPRPLKALPSVRLTAFIFLSEAPGGANEKGFYFRSQEQPLAQTPTLDKLLPSRLKKNPNGKGPQVSDRCPRHASLPYPSFSSVMSASLPRRSLRQLRIRAGEGPVSSRAGASLIGWSQCVCVPWALRAPLPIARLLSQSALRAEACGRRASGLLLFHFLFLFSFFFSLNFGVLYLKSTKEY